MEKADSISGRFARRMRAVRQHRNMTQGELAQAIGVHRATVPKLESGDRRITIAEAVAIAEALDVNLADLVTPAPLELPPTPAVTID